MNSMWFLFSACSPRDGEQHCQRSEEGPVAVPDPARVDFCVEDVARLGLAQQEALDAPSDRLVAYVLLDGEAVLGGNHALVEAELLAGAVVAAKEREHSVEYGPDFVNLVGLVHGLVHLIDQVQEAQRAMKRSRSMTSLKPGVCAMKLWPAPCQ